MVTLNISVDCQKCGEKEEYEKELDGSEEFLRNSAQQFGQLRSQEHFIGKHIESEKEVEFEVEIESEEFENEELAIRVGPIEDEEVKEELKNKYLENEED